MLQDVLGVEIPGAAFYLWARTPIADTEFAIKLYRDFNVTVLPGSFLSRKAHGINPGAGFIRLALVASQEECLGAARRIQQLI
jgi:N-succinyldiaminopimelate aminotransferase